ncbi:MAG: lipocalin family protein [Bacteroidales bacterium]|nr:lipocalin family protein [Bacteroidales bacterium]
MKYLLTITLFMLTLFSCQSVRELPTVKNADLEKYSGKWYEIARLPNSFEKGLKCTSAEYHLKKNGKLTVINRGHQEEDAQKVKSVKGFARIPDKSEPGQLKVYFFWPFGGDYYIIELDKDYQYVLVGAPSRKYLWILARENKLNDDIYNKLVVRAKELGFDTQKLIRVKHDC